MSDDTADHKTNRSDNKSNASSIVTSETPLLFVGNDSDKALFSPSQKKKQRAACFTRWVVLITFSLLYAFNAVIWMTFSASGDGAIKYYNWTQPRGANGSFYNLPGNGVDALGTQDLLLNWGCITILVAVFPLMWFMTRGGSEVLWGALMFSTSLCTVASFLRLVPTLIQFVSPSSHYVTSKSAVYWLHASAIAIGIAGTAFAPITSELAATWFPPQGRTTATAVAFSAYYIGISLGFLIGFCENLPRVLIVESVVSVVLTLVWFFIPRKPKEPPSQSAALKQQQKMANDNGAAASCGAMWSSIWRLCKMPSIWLLVLCGGFGPGMFSGFGVSIEQELEARGLSAVLSTWLGFSIPLLQMVGTLVIPAAVEASCSQKLKLMTCLLFVILLVCYVIFCLSLPFATFTTPLIPPNVVVLFATVSIASTASATSAAFFYELTAEVAYPVSEDITGCYLTWFVNLGSVLYLFIYPAMSDVPTYQNVMLLCVMSLSVFGCFFVRERYLRSEADGAV